MNSANAVFEQADINRDGSLSQNEFRNFLARNSVASSDVNNLGLGAAGGGGYGSSSYESSYRSSVGNMGGDFGNINVAGTAGLSAADAASANFSSSSQSMSVQQYQTDEQGNFKDPNPQVVRRPAQSGPLTYSQNIRVRFLQPPAVPPPGVRFVCLKMNFISI